MASPADVHAAIEMPRGWFAAHCPPGADLRVDLAALAPAVPALLPQGSGFSPTYIFVCLAEALDFECFSFRRETFEFQGIST